MSSSESIKNFWKWFENNNHKFLFLNEVTSEEKDSLLDKFLEQLHKFSPELYFEIGGHPKEGKVELIITAEGIIEHFQKVEELVDGAPELENWRYIKFRQAHGTGFSTEYRGKTFDPEKIIFIPLTNKNHTEAVGMQVCFSDYNEEEHEIFINGTYIMLDTLIGEKSTSLDIDYLKVTATPENIGEFNFLYVSEIASYISDIKGKERKQGI